MTLSNLRFNVRRSVVNMATNLPSCFFIQFLEQLLKFLANFTLLKYVKSQRSYGFLITKELIFGFQILDLKDHFSASLRCLLSRSRKYKNLRLSILWGPFNKYLIYFTFSKSVAVKVSSQLENLNSTFSASYI